MQPCSDLATLQQKATRKLYRLRHCIVQAVEDEQRRFQLLSFAITNIQSVWTEYCRAIYLSSVGGARTASGSRAFSPTVAYSDAIDVAVRNVSNPKTQKPLGYKWDRREEPPWHDPIVFAKCLEAAKCTNYKSVLAGISVGTDSLRHLPISRNYFCHVGENTHNKVVKLARNYSVNAISPVDLLVSRAPKRPTAIAFDWASDFITAVEQVAI